MKKKFHVVVELRYLAPEKATEESERRLVQDTLKDLLPEALIMYGDIRVEEEVK